MKCNNNNLPLSGTKVLDFTQVMMGPSATQTLADYGAEVIKVERAGSGDLSRSAFTDPAGPDNPVFQSLNRNKRSLALDLRRDEHKEVVWKLLETTDVVVSNFRPGVMERMGFGYEAVSSVNPRIIFAIGSGFGLEGPYVRKGGQDALAQAMTGVMYRRADDSLPMSVPATTFGDYSAGMHMVQGILLALLQREKTGEGQVISVSLYDSLLAAQMQEATMHMMRGQEVNWAGMPLTGCFETSDGALVLVGAFKANPLQDICRALEIEDLSQNPNYADFDGQKRNKVRLQSIFRERFSTNTTEYWLDRLDQQDLLCAPVRSLDEALADPQTRINGMILETQGNREPIKVIGSPIHLSHAPVSVRCPAPTLGQDNEAILNELGLIEETLV